MPRYSQQVINSARLAGRTPAEQARIMANVEADRLMGQRRRARVVAKKPPVPLTPAERRRRRAAAIRDRMTPSALVKLRKQIFGG